MMDHHGWMWWKKQDPNWPQLKFELVDIWHFGMGDFLVKYGQDGAARLLAEAAKSHATAPYAAGGFVEAVESFAERTLRERGFDAEGFFRLAGLAALSFDELFRRYVAKNVLSRFRQDHGYKSGTYEKLWHGREDNEHLNELAGSMEIAKPDFPDRLYAALKARYVDAKQD